MKVSAVDLFCGVGGLTNGLIKSGLNVVAGFDVDESCRYAYEHNNHTKFYKEDLSKIDVKKISDCFEKNTIKVLVGCAPCQPFSSCTPRTHAGKNNSKWDMLNHYKYIIKNIQPDIISMENVPQIINTDIFKDFLTDIKGSGYHICYNIVHCEQYGIPQKRRRMVLLASKLGDIEIIPPNNISKNLYDAISALPPIKDGETYKDDPLHCCQKLSPINKKRIEHSVQGGSWNDWPDELKLECHKKESGKTYASVYGRMDWDKPSSTITTQFFNYGSGRFGHPTQNRALSLREGALIQTFPLDYEFTPNNKVESIANVAMHIGNAVPVELGRIIGKSIMDHIISQKGLE